MRSMSNSCVVSRKDRSELSVLLEVGSRGRQQVRRAVHLRRERVRGQIEAHGSHLRYCLHSACTHKHTARREDNSEHTNTTQSGTHGKAK